MNFSKLLLFIIIVNTFLYSQEPSANSTKEVKTIVKTINGKDLQVVKTHDGLIFKELKNKIILLEFFGHSCPPCRASIPGYNKFLEKYKDKIAVLAVEVWGLNHKQLSDFTKEMHIKYLVATQGESGALIRFVQQLTGWHPKYGVPFLIIFKPDGKLYKYIPPKQLPEAYIEHLLNDLLKKDS